MIRFAAELWAILAVSFVIGSLVGWLLSRLIRPLFGRSGADEDDDSEDEAEALVPLPEVVPVPKPSVRREEGPLTIEASLATARPAPQPARPRAAQLPPRMRPPALPGPRQGRADALQRLPGLTRRHADRLYSIGIYHFSQIAAWTPQEVAWVAAQLDLGEGTSADEWVANAARIAASEPPSRRPRV